MKEYKSITQRYCPVVGHNIIMETVTSEDKSKCYNCLNKHVCENQGDGCQYQPISQAMSKNKTIN